MHTDAAASFLTAQTTLKRPRVGIAPLRQTDWNAAKSWIKPLEYAMVGVVDRLDRTPDGLRVTDYKTGSSISRVVQDGRLTLEVQLPLYMEALGAVNGRYLSIEKAEELAGAGPAAESPRRIRLMTRRFSTPWWVKVARQTSAMPPAPRRS
jgi:RecB family exonuclease